MVGRATHAFRRRRLRGLQRHDQLHRRHQCRDRRRGHPLFAGDSPASSWCTTAGGRLVVTVDDVAYKMGLGNQVRTFLAQTVSDVVSAISSEYGLQATVDCTTGQLPYLLQTGSDLDCSAALAGTTGYDWWVDDHPALQRPVTRRRSPRSPWATICSISRACLRASTRARRRSPAGRPRQAPADAAPLPRTQAELHPDSGAGHRLRQRLRSRPPTTPARRLSITVHAGRDRWSASLAQRWVSQAVTARGPGGDQPRDQRAPR